VGQNASFGKILRSAEKERACLDKNGKKLIPYRKKMAKGAGTL
jgi:hypothetical protein